jgi:PIN domain
VIVILDTCSLHGDVYAERPLASTLFATAAEQEDLDVWIPSVVVEELVRKFPERLKELIQGVKGLRHDASAFGWDMPSLPDADAEVEAYRGRLEGHLRDAGVRIASPPARAGLVAEWVAQRRQPIPGDGSGVVDAQIWLTAAEAAETGEVALISDNSSDFSDPEELSRPHEVLRGDLESWGISPARIEIFPRILEFNERYITPSLEATELAKALLADPDSRRMLLSEIESAVAWTPLDVENWDFGAADIEEATLGTFDIGALRLIRADPGAKGLSLTLEAYGAATVDLGMFRADALGLPEDSPIIVDDWDWNEWNVSAHTEVAGSVLLEVLHSDEDFAISVDEVAQIGELQLLELLDAWLDRGGEAAFDVVAESFDVSGQQEARAVQSRAVEKFYFKDGDLFLRAEFTVDYANPVDEEDRELSAENVAEHIVDLRIEAPDLEDMQCGDVTWVEHAFPT